MFYVRVFHPLIVLCIRGFTKTDVVVEGEMKNTFNFFCAVVAPWHWRCRMENVRNLKTNFG